MIKPDPAKKMLSHLYAPSIRLQTYCNDQSNHHLCNSHHCYICNSHHCYKTQKRKSFADFFQYFFLFTDFLSRYNNGRLGRNVAIYFYLHRSSSARNFLTQ
jgi:hypothetical protein